MEHAYDFILVVKLIVTTLYLWVWTRSYITCNDSVVFQCNKTADILLIVHLVIDKLAIYITFQSHSKSLDITWFDYYLCHFIPSTFL